MSHFSFEIFMGLIFQLSQRKKVKPNFFLKPPDFSEGLADGKYVPTVKKLSTFALTCQEKGILTRFLNWSWAI